MPFEFETLSAFRGQVNNKDPLDATTWQPQLIDEFNRHFAHHYKRYYLISFFILSAIVATVMGVVFMPEAIGSLMIASFASLSNPLLLPSIYFSAVTLGLGLITSMIYLLHRSEVLDNELMRVRNWADEAFHEDHISDFDRLVGVISLTKGYLELSTSLREDYPTWHKRVSSRLLEPSELIDNELEGGTKAEMADKIPGSKVYAHQNLQGANPDSHEILTLKSKDHPAPKLAEMKIQDTQTAPVPSLDEQFLEAHGAKVNAAYEALNQLLNYTVNHSEKNGESDNYNSFVTAYGTLGNAWNGHVQSNSKGCQRFPVRQDLFDFVRKVSKHNHGGRMPEDEARMIDNIEQKSREYNELQLNERYMRLVANQRRQATIEEHSRMRQQSDHGQSGLSLPGFYQ